MVVLASKELYEVSLRFYEFEVDRQKALSEKAKLVIGIISLYIGLLVFRGRLNIDVSNLSGGAQVTFVIGLLLLAFSVVLSILSLQIRVYESPYNPVEFIQGLGENEQDLGLYFDDRIIDLAVAWEKNTRQNNNAAQYLQGAFICLGAAIVSHILTLGLTALPLSW